VRRHELAPHPAQLRSVSALRSARAVRLGPSGSAASANWAAQIWGSSPFTPAT
jgi:hypothetical protein